MIEILNTIDSLVWGPVMIAFLLGTHVFLTIRTGFIQRKLPQAIRMSLKGDSSSKGDISNFGALATALAATIGTGSIVGVATAIIAGGPGAVFWMWIAGIFGIADQAAFASATFMGLFIGASLLAPLADKLGRRLTFMVALAWYGLFSLLMATQSSAEGVIFFRFLVGIGLGIELVTIDTYLSEWVPTHLRNKAFAFALFI